jgi:outer membrane protein assembly factor BamE
VSGFGYYAFSLALKEVAGGITELFIRFSGTRPRTTLIQILKAIALVGIFASMIGCNNISSLDFPGVYKIGIPQGNIITQDMVDQLRPGMTKRQVIFVMGTPLVRDPFHQNRWDYIYSYQPGGGDRGQERVSVFFEDDLLVRFNGDFVPTPPEDSAIPTPPEESVASSGDQSSSV